MKVRALNRRERLLAAGTLAASLAGLLYLFAIEPLFVQWRAARDEASAEGAKLVELRTLVENRSQIEKQYGLYAGALPHGPSREDLEVRLLKEIEMVASEAGVRVTTMKPLAARESGQMQRVSIEVHAACAANQFTRLLQLLQEPSHLFKAESFTLEAGREDPPLTVTLTLAKLVYIDGAKRQSGAADD